MTPAAMPGFFVAQRKLLLRRFRVRFAGLPWKFIQPAEVGGHLHAAAPVAAHANAATAWQSATLARTNHPGEMSRERGSFRLGIHKRRLTSTGNRRQNKSHNENHRSRFPSVRFSGASITPSSREVNFCSPEVGTGFVERRKAKITASSGGARRTPQNGTKMPRTTGAKMEANMGTRLCRRIR